MQYLLLLWLSLAQTSASTAATFVASFYSIYIKQHSSGLFLQGDAKRALDPLLSERLRRQLDEAAECQADWVRQQPKGSTDKPPFVECCLFSGSPDGMPTSFSLGPTEILPDSRYGIVVDFVRKESAGDITWRDAVIVVKDGAHFAVDDVVYDADRGSMTTGRLSDSFQGCRGRHWIGGH